MYNNQTLKQLIKEINKPKKKPKKLKESDVFEIKKKKKNLPKNTHLMPDGKTIMSGKIHSKNSKKVGMLK